MAADLVVCHGIPAVEDFSAVLALELARILDYLWILCIVDGWGAI